MLSSSAKPASALLLTLLIMVSVSSIVLTSARAIMNSTRLVGAADSAGWADQMAQSGIEEGINRINQNSLTATNGEYGINASANAIFGTTYTLSDMRRGFKIGSKCQVFITNDDPARSLADQNCPYYETSIRTMVSISSDTTQYSSSFSLLSRDLVPGAPLTLPVSQFSASSIQITPTFVNPGGHITCQALDSANAVVSGVCPADNTGLFTLTTDALPSHVRFLKFSVTQPISSVVISNTLAQPFTIGKGYTTVDSVGYVGGVAKRLLLTIAANGTRTLTNTSQAFDVHGIMQ